MKKQTWTALPKSHISQTPGLLTQNPKSTQSLCTFHYHPHSGFSVNICTSICKQHGHHRNSVTLRGVHKEKDDKRKVIIEVLQWKHVEKDKLDIQGICNNKCVTCLPGACGGQKWALDSNGLG